MQTTPKTTIKKWFTSQETKELIQSIITVIELSNVKIGDTDDQILLMNLINDMTNE